MLLTRAMRVLSIILLLAAAVLARPGVDLKPLRATTFELDEPAVPLPSPKTPARP